MPRDRYRDEDDDDFPGGRHVVHDHDHAERSPGPPRVSVGQRLGRAAAGFFLGWVWCSVASLCWLGALTVGYGGLDRGLLLLKGEWWAPIGFAAYCGSLTGSWIGGTVGPVALGLSRNRRPVLGSSLLGGACGGVLAAAVGAIAGWLVWRESPRSLLALQIPLGLGVLLGGLAGWLAGRSLSRP